jgi:hypothetical protein
MAVELGDPVLLNHVFGQCVHDAPPWSVASFHPRAEPPTLEANRSRAGAPDTSGTRFLESVASRTSTTSA